MTTDMLTLRAHLEKSSDVDLLREMLAFGAERLMELEVEQRTGAAHGERSPDRITQRNGYRERGWDRLSLRLRDRQLRHLRQPAEGRQGRHAGPRRRRARGEGDPGRQAPRLPRSAAKRRDDHLAQALRTAARIKFS